MTEQWIIANPGGPAGPFWGIVSSSGRVVAMQIPDEATAKEIVGLRAANVQLRRQVGDLEQAMIDLSRSNTDAIAENARLRHDCQELEWGQAAAEAVMLNAEAELERVYAKLHDLQIRAGVQ
jgi:hypothetical protein